MTREELKAHCEKQIEMCEFWAIGKGEKPSGKIYEEHKLILELLEQETVSKEVYDHEYFLRKEFELKIAKLEHDKNEVLDKLRAEIAEYGSIMVSYAITKDTKTDKGIEKLVSGVLKQAKEQVLEVIDKYRAEIEPQESEG